MPKRADFIIFWSKTNRQYQITDSDSYSPRFESEHTLPIRLNTKDWFDWLARISSFQFRSVDGNTFTVRKETRIRGTEYWVGYKKVQGKLKKQYLGTSKALNSKTLETAARTFAETKAQSHEQKPEEPKPLYVFNNTLAGALHIFGFQALPKASEIQKRYRQLAKVHYPDLGGSHADMVAINLAYAYLKRLL